MHPMNLNLKKSIQKSYGNKSTMSNCSSDPSIDKESKDPKLSLTTSKINQIMLNCDLIVPQVVGSARSIELNDKSSFLRFSFF